MTSERASDPTAPRPTAVLVSVQLPGISDEQHEADLAELGRLVDTLGLEVLGTVVQRRHHLAAGVVLGAGKLRELALWTGGSGEVPTGAAEKKDKARLRRQDEQDEGLEGDAELEGEDVAGAGWSDEEDEGSGEGEQGDFAPPARLAEVVVLDHEVSPR
jgi:GTP-binding protein HflX